MLNDKVSEIKASFGIEHTNLVPDALSDEVVNVELLFTASPGGGVTSTAVLTLKDGEHVSGDSYSTTYNNQDATLSAIDNAQHTLLVLKGYDSKIA